MKFYTRTLIFISFIFLFNSCEESNKTYGKPNVILIMADDLGYEAIGINGADEYKLSLIHI